ncbi:MAG: DNA repair protein RecO [Caldimicrobium sp.]
MLFTLPALILDKIQIKEIDYLVTLFTPRGRIKAIAKGAQKSKKRFLNLLEDLTYLRAHLRKPKKGQYLILERVDLFYMLESPWRDLKRFYLFSYIAEVLSFTNPPFLRREDFNFVVELLKEMDETPFSFEDKFFWEFKWLQICGLSPYIDTCVNCGSSPKKIFYFSISKGGLLCFSCKDLSVTGLTFKQIDLLRKIGRIKKLKEAKEFMTSLSAEERKDLFSLIENFFLYHFNWEPKSLRVMRENNALR